MKKYCILISSVIILLSILIFCITIKEDYKIRKCEINSSSFVYEYSKKDIKDKLKIDVNVLNDYKVVASLSKLESERIMIFSIKEGYIKDVKNKVVSYFNDLEEEYKDTNQYKIIKNIKTYQKDNLYIVVVSKDVNNIIKELKERLI